MMQFFVVYVILQQIIANNINLAKMGICPFLTKFSVKCHLSQTK